MRKNSFLIILCSVFFLAACGPKEPASEVVLPTETIPSDTPIIPTNTAAFPPIPTDTSTPTPIPTPKYIQASNFGQVQLLHTFNDNVTVWTWKLSPDGTYLAYGGDSAVVYIFSLYEGEIIAEIPSTVQVQSLAWAPNGQYLAAGLAFGRVLMVDTASWQEVISLSTENRNNFYSIDWSPDSSKLIGVTNDGNRINGYIYLWDIETFELIYEFSPGERGPHWSDDTLCWDADSEMVSIVWKVNVYPNAAYDWMLFDTDNFAITNQKRLVYGVGYGYSPTICSPDGTILLVENRPGGTTVFVNAETAEDVGVVETNGRFLGLCVTPDAMTMSQKSQGQLIFTDIDTVATIGVLDSGIGFSTLDWASDCSMFTIDVGYGNAGHNDAAASVIEIWGLP